MDLKSKIRIIENFPKEGISFKDITTLLKDKDALAEMIDQMCDRVKDLEFDYIAGIEARGFIVGTPMAIKLGKGFIPVRKPGKLPGNIIRESYDLEYGQNEIEMDADVLKKGDRVLLVDDLLATGGTAKAAANLITKAGAEVAGVGFLVELTSLEGMKMLDEFETFSLVQYEK
ncbi:MAG: adenine phosphoribosyltransferase [Tissierellia bacterium]|nr:adenine phosphoribosyltransferase [Tissierellia bacterium]